MEWEYLKKKAPRRLVLSLADFILLVMTGKLQVS